jgi:hypothetical protein
MVLLLRYNSTTMTQKWCQMHYYDAIIALHVNLWAVHFGYSRKAFWLKPHGLSAAAARLFSALLLPVHTAVYSALKP